MKRIIKPTDSARNESNRHTIKSIGKSEIYSVWIANKSTIPVSIGALDESDNAIIGATYIQPNERKEFSIDSEAILAIELEKLVPENEALFFADEDSMEPAIQIADDTDYIGEPIKIGIASEVFALVAKEDYDIVILQENKY